MQLDIAPPEQGPGGHAVPMHSSASKRYLLLRFLFFFLIFKLVGAVWQHQSCSTRNTTTFGNNNLVPLGKPRHLTTSSENHDPWFFSGFGSWPPFFLKTHAASRRREVWPRPSSRCGTWRPARRRTGRGTRWPIPSPLGRVFFFFFFFVFVFFSFFFLRGGGRKQAGATLGRFLDGVFFVFGLGGTRHLFCWGGKRVNRVEGSAREVFLTVRFCCFHLSSGWFPILFNHRSVQKPAVSLGFQKFSRKKDPWKEWGR